MANKVWKFEVAPGSYLHTWLNCDMDFRVSIYAQNGSPNTENVHINFADANDPTNVDSVQLEVPYGNALQFIAQLPFAEPFGGHVELWATRHGVTQLTLYVEADETANVSVTH